MEVGGLPVDLRQLIFSYLCLSDLGHCGLVFRGWCELVLSLDRTRWQQLCLGCLEHRHPSWPNRPSVEQRSRQAFKHHSLASKTWTKNTQDPESSTCLSLFRRRKGRCQLCIGVGGEFSSLQATLAVASPCDWLVLLLGVHEEPSEVLLKVLVEVVGQGRLGDVALLASIDQSGPTACLHSLVLIPACFFSVLCKLSSGYVQFDNCNFEGGQLQIQVPGTCQVKFCTFSSSIHLRSVALCVLENCEFTGSENASVTMEGCPSSDRNWACKHLAVLAKSCAVFVQQPDPAGAERDSLGGIAAGTTQDTEFGDNLQAAKEEEYPALDSKSSNSESRSNDEEDAQAARKVPCQAHRQSRVCADVTHSRLHALQRDLKLKSLQQELQQDKEAQLLASSLQGCIIRQCLFRDRKGGIFIYSRGQAKLEGSIFRDLTYAAVRCIQNSKVL
ncbi:LOW QUALITY PROTEIN: F-box only protein 10 [Pterocles gutturalis]